MISCADISVVPCENNLHSIIHGRMNRSQKTKPTMKSRWPTFNSSKRPRYLKLRSSNWLITTTVCLAVFTDIFLYGVIVPVLPAVLNKRAGIREDDTQMWTSILLAVYGGALFISSPICGYLADKTSHRQIPFLAGLIVLSVGTALLCIGSSIGLFIAGRLLQGISGAVVWIVGLAMLVDTVGREGIAHYMGFVSTAMSMGILCGPLLGGVLYEAGGYYAVFGLAFGILGLDIVLRLVMVERKVAEKFDDSQEKRDDQSGSGVGDAEASSGIRDVGLEVEQDMTDEAVNRTKLSSWRHRMPPTISLLFSGRLLVALFATIAIGIIMTGFDAVLPLFVETVFQWNTIGGGLIFLPLFIPSLLSYFAGKFADKFGPRYIATAGFLITIPPLVLLRLVNSKTINQEVLLCALLAIVGVGLALNLPAIMAEIIYVVDAKEKEDGGILENPMGATAQAYGLFNGAFAVGTLVGPIWAGYVRDEAGFGTMGWSLALLMGVTAIPVLLMTGGNIFGRRDETL